MPSPDLWTRLRQARIVRVLAFYLGASWIVLQVVDVLQEALALPPWVAPTSVILLMVGGVIMVATALVQGSPSTDAKEAAGEVPGSWEVAPKRLGRSLAQGRLPHLTWGRSLLGGIMAFWFLFGLAGLYVVLRDRGQSFAPVEAMADEAGTGIAVMPFQVQGTADLELWREGMVDLFSTNLDGVGGFRTIDSRTVLARWGEAVGEEVAPDLAAILSVASATGAGYAMVGSAVGLVDDVRLSADIYEVATGTEVGQAQVEGSVDEVLTLVDQLSVDVMRALLEGAGAELPPIQHTASITTSSLPALRAYLESEAHYRAADFTSAIEALERAVQADSMFALAYYRLSDAYGWVENISSEQGEVYMRRARELSDRLPPRYAALLNGAVGLLDGDLTVLPDLEEAVRRYPDDPEMWFLLGELYLHYSGQSMKGIDEVYRVFDRAIQLDPTFAPYYIHLIEMEIKKGDGPRATERLARLTSMVEDRQGRGYLALGRDLAFGDSAEVAAAQAAIDTTSSVVQLWAQLGVNGIGTANMERVAHAAEARNPGPGARTFTAWAYLMNGKVRQAEEVLADEIMPPGARAFRAYIMRRTIGALDDATLDRYLAPESCGEGHLSPECAWAVASHAAEQGRWAIHADFLERHRTIQEEMLAEGDSAHARAHGNAAVTLEARELWLNGRRQDAIRALESVQGDGAGNDSVVRFMLGTMHEELGQSRQAVRYYESFWNDINRWWFALRLGDLYAELGENERARGYYALFLEDWANADEGRPEVARAQAAIRQLGG
jgi:tetratricopeptide (TPR) repeat protein